MRRMKSVVRTLYETTQEKQPMIQMVQPPMILSLSMQEEQALKEHQELFRELGFEIESLVEENMQSAAYRHICHQ